MINLPEKTVSNKMNENSEHKAIRSDINTENYWMQMRRISKYVK